MSWAKGMHLSFRFRMNVCTHTSHDNDSEPGEERHLGSTTILSTHSSCKAVSVTILCLTIFAVVLLINHCVSIEN
jgi:hypothetical protein